MTRRSSSPALADPLPALPVSGGPAACAGAVPAHALEALRRCLSASGYETIYRLHCYELAPRFLHESLRGSYEHAGENAQLLLQLLAFEREVRRAAAEALLGVDCVAALIEAGVFASEGDRLRSRYVLEIAGDTCLFTENFRGRPDGVYFGEDSHFLRSVLRPRVGDVCLDLCAGTGVQGLRCAQRAEHVDLVDINPDAVRVARLNAALNGLSERVEVHRGDLWEPLPPERRYDYAVWNPPLMPVADEVRYPIFGHGGPDGLRLVRRILEVLPDRLRKGGRCACIGACVGDDRTAEIEKLARALLGERFEIELYLLLRLPLRDWVRTIAKTSEAFYPGESFQSAVLRSRTAYRPGFDDTYVYTYLLEGTEVGAGGRLHITDLSRVGHSSYWFVNRGTLTQ